MDFFNRTDRNIDICNIGYFGGRNDNRKLLEEEMLVWCEQYKINIEKDFVCKLCIFLKENKCIYSNWKPGLKNGKDLEIK